MVALKVSNCQIRGLYLFCFSWVHSLYDPFFMWSYWVPMMKFSSAEVWAYSGYVVLLWVNWVDRQLFLFYIYIYIYI